MATPEVVYQLDESTDPAKITLTLRGGCNCRMKHPVEPSVTKAAKRVQMIQQRRNEERKTGANGAQKIPQDDDNPFKLTKADKKRIHHKEFMDKGVYMALYGTLEKKVKCASMCTDHLLNQKRDKLRRLLLAEEECYTKEFVGMCLAEKERREEDLRRKANEIKARMEEEQRQLVEEKIKQLKIQNCDLARPMKTKAALLLTKEDQLWQIKERRLLEEAKREEEKIYHDLMLKNLMEMKKKDEEYAIQQCLKQQEARATFIEQMKWKKMKNEEEKEIKEFERKQVEEISKKYKELASQESEERRKKNLERIAEFKEYLARDREIRERRQKEEEEIDQAFIKLLLMEEEKERQMISSEKEKLKREMLNYMENCREMQRLREIDEARNNQLIEQLSEAIRAQQDAAKVRLKAARNELYTNVMKERADQIKEKKEREKREEEARNDEIELLNLQIEQQRKIREDYERRCAEKRREYGEQLKKQMIEFEQMRKREKEEEEEYRRQLMLEDERKRKEVEEILRTSDIGVHPMKQLVIAQPPRGGRGLPCPR